MTVYSTATPGSIPTDPDDEDEVIPVKIVRPETGGLDLAAALIFMVLHQAFIAGMLWLLAALLIPEAGIHYGITVLVALTFRLAIFTRHRYSWWTHSS
jgi:hypothetical protein